MLICWWEAVDTNVGKGPEESPKYTGQCECPAVQNEAIEYLVWRHRSHTLARLPRRVENRALRPRAPLTPGREKDMTRLWELRESPAVLSGPWLRQR